MLTSLSSLTSFLRRPDTTPPVVRQISGVGLRIVVLLLAILCCWLLAGLFQRLLNWQSTPPSLILPTSSITDTSGGRNALIKWFSTAKQGKVVDNSTRGLELMAVIAGKDGVAVINGASASGPAAYPVGDEVRPGLRLHEVLGDHVVFDQNGKQAELSFPAVPKTVQISVGNEAPEADANPEEESAPAVAASAPAEAQSLKVSRGDLMGMAQEGNLGDWDKGLSNFANGGVRVTDASEQPLAQILKLKNGDIVQSVNDRDVAEVGDVSLIYSSFSQSQAVDLTVLRDGKSLKLHFDIQP